MFFFCFIFSNRGVSQVGELMQSEGKQLLFAINLQDLFPLFLIFVTEVVSPFFLLFLSKINDLLLR
jgi:hypothetical protein